MCTSLFSISSIPSLQIDSSIPFFQQNFSNLNCTYVLERSMHNGQLLGEEKLNWEAEKGTGVKTGFRGVQVIVPAPSGPLPSCVSLEEWWWCWSGCSLPFFKHMLGSWCQMLKHFLSLNPQTDHVKFILSKSWISKYLYIYPAEACVCMCECVCVSVSVCLLVTQLCPTLCDPMDSSLPGSSVHGILQARILRSSWPRVLTLVSCIAGRFFTVWTTRQTET